MSLSVKGFKYRTIGTTNALLYPEPIHPSPSRRGEGLLGKNNKEMKKRLEELMVEFEGRVIVYRNAEIEIKNIKYWDEGNENIEFMCELNGYLVRDSILRDSKINMLKEQITEIISVNSFGMALMG